MKRQLKIQMARPVLFIAVLLLALTARKTLGALQQITIYQGMYFEGDSITLSGKYADLSEFKYFLTSAQSYCSTGYWRFYPRANFSGGISVFSAWESKTEICNPHHRFFFEYQSGGFLGPEEFTVPAISVFEGAQGTGAYGHEFIVTGPAQARFPFEPSLALCFGNSSWTLFAEENFAGTAACLEPYLDGVYTGSSRLAVKSVVRGCKPSEVQRNIQLFERNSKTPE